jgi:protease-4
MVKKSQKSRETFIIALILSVIIIGVLILIVGEKGDITKPGIAIIPVNGVISSNSNGASPKLINDFFNQANKDVTIKAIILEINSPGGTVVASREIEQIVKESDKPVVVLMKEVAASGGYWIATPAETIIADPATITGSIGVTSSYLQFAELMGKYGVTYERLVSGEYKDVGSPYKELTPKERELLQRKIDAINEMFIEAISANRDSPREQVRALATGEILLGTEALDYGLIDSLGGINEAQNTAEALLGVESSRLVRYEKEPSLFDLFSQASVTNSYAIGRGIGDSWNPMNEQEDFLLMADL